MAVYIRRYADYSACYTQVKVKSSQESAATDPRQRSTVHFIFFSCSSLNAQAKQILKSVHINYFAKVRKKVKAVPLYGAHRILSRQRIYQARPYKDVLYFTLGSANSYLLSVR